MAKIDCIKNTGELEFFWNTSDHIPPHFHVKHKGGEWEIRVYFLESGSKLEYDFKFPSKRTQRIKASIEKEILGKIKNKDATLLKEWEKKVNYEQRG